MTGFLFCKRLSLKDICYEQINLLNLKNTAGRKILFWKQEKHSSCLVSLKMLHETYTNFSWKVDADETNFNIYSF